MMVIIAIACLPLSLSMAIGEEKKRSTRQKTSPLNLSVREATCPPNNHRRNSFQTFPRLEPRARLALCNRSYHSTMLVVTKRSGRGMLIS
ncbi:hypothetical protein BGX38DRAFT_1186627 [Terfezia claveryi]|nr:hypothetical protein BGX38DRAFT_1186627 [Terfezia claveryi]